MPLMNLCLQQLRVNFRNCKLNGPNGSHGTPLNIKIETLKVLNICIFYIYKVHIAAFHVFRFCFSYVYMLYFLPLLFLLPAVFSCCEIITAKIHPARQIFSVSGLPEYLLTLTRQKQDMIHIVHQICVTEYNRTFINGVYVHTVR